jgi:precorrin-6B methylase 2
MHHIRPYKLFMLVEGQPADKIAHTALPHRRAAGGLTLLETFTLTAASRVVKAGRVFEFGTFHGSTTLNLALNIPDNGTVFTLDLDEHLAEDVKQDAEDAPLTEIHLASKSSLDFLGSPVERKVKTLTGNSTIFDFSAWNESIDLIFIDGGHDLSTVKSDSENALRMACKNKPSCILWHDYRNPRYSGLTYYLDELSQQQRLVHVEDTMLCAWFNDPGEFIWPGLLST